MKEFILLIVTFLLCIVSLHAAYLTDVPISVTQPDGSVLNCYASGDEYHNWLHDSEHYTIIQDQDTGYYTYADKSRGKLTPTDLIPGRDNPVHNGLQPYSNISRDEYQAKRKAWLQDTPKAVKTPTSGFINNLVIYIRFSDQTEFTEPFTTYNSMFNNTIPNTNSMYNYFLEDSYQALTINTSFYPLPENHMVVSYQDSLPRAYFLPYSSTNPTGYDGSTERREREHALLVRAVQYVSAVIPSSLNIDADNDGKVDNICFIVKGSSGAWADLLWPHMWSLYTYEVFLNGARVYTYNFQLENSLTSSGVGVLCHEMSHSLGFPDLYHYDSNGIAPVSRWDLMESNRNPPQHHTAFMKTRYGNWLPPMRQITQTGTYWVNKMLNPVGNCYKILADNPQYHYVVEFRKQEGFFESSIPGTGLLIYRVDTAEDGNGNADGPPDELYAYRPNGTVTANGSPLSAHYSLETGRTAINATTNPTPFLGNGQPGGLNITQIGSSVGDSISFYIEVQSLPPLDYDEGFESGDFMSYAWTPSGDSLWIVDNAGAYQGGYCAKSGPIDHLQTSILSLSVQVPVNGIIAFFKRTSCENNYDYLKFYIDDVQQGQWTGSSNWSYVQFPITQGIHSIKWAYVKDQGVSSGSDCAWLDNILFRWDASDLLPPPVNFTASPLAENMVSILNWQPPFQITSSLSGYRIFKDGIQILDVDSTVTNYMDFDLLPGSLHSYYIKAFYQNPNGHSAATETASVQTIATPVIPVIDYADVVDTNSVLLQWSVPHSDLGIIGYLIYRDGVLVNTVESDTIFEWIDPDLPDGVYYYQVASRYTAFVTELSGSMLVVVYSEVSNQDSSVPVLDWGLKSIYPNPAHADVKIRYDQDKDTSVCELSVYNLKGQKIKQLMRGQSKAGSHLVNWNGTNDQGSKTGSGIYFVVLKDGSRTSVQRVLLFK